MYQLCRHIKTNGLRCQSPALRDSAYCYFHSRVRASDKASRSVMATVEFPLLEDSASIQIALSQISAALIHCRIDNRRAGLLLYALQIASQNIDRHSCSDDDEAVHFITVTGEGEELAPKKKVCEPSDCAACKRRDTCDDYDPDAEEESAGDDDEEEQESSNLANQPTASLRTRQLPNSQLANSPASQPANSANPVITPACTGNLSFQANDEAVVPRSSRLYAMSGS